MIGHDTYPRPLFYRFIGRLEGKWMESRASPLSGEEADSTPHEPGCGLSADRNLSAWTSSPHIEGREMRSVTGLRLSPGSAHRRRS
jgi:hypothetical protein